MSTTATPTTPPTPAATPPVEEGMDATFGLLYAAAEAEGKQAEPPEEKTSGMSLAQALSDDTPPVPSEAEKKKQEDDAKKKKDEEAAAAAASPAPQVKVRRREAAPAPAAPAPTPAAATPPPAPQVKEKTDDEKFEEGLLEEERDQLELARFAEQKDPVKYKGYAAKVTKFLKDHQAYLEKNPKAVEPGTDEEAAYTAWMQKNGVSLPPRELKLLEREQIAEKARTDLSRETDQKLAEIHDENFRRDAEPNIQREADAVFQQLAGESLPKEFLALAKEKGIEEAKKAYPTEYRVAQGVLVEAASDIEELRRLTTSNPKTGRPLKSYDKGNPQHVRILDFITEQCANFKNGAPGETAEQRALRLRHQVKDGKSFLTRDEYYKLPADQRGAHWTFDIDQVIAMSKIAAKNRITEGVKSEFARREAEGWQRKPAAAAPAEPTPPAGAPPAPRPSPIPPASSSAASDQPDKAFSLLMGGPAS